nr:protein ANTAGONIST OF LIKE HETEROCHROMATIN PROTEIN 1-like [Leptinotarsa decemlineata]
MSIRTFDELHNKLENSLTFSNQIRISISSVERLCVALRYLASGNTFTDLHYTYRLGISTISNIVEQVCYKIWEFIGPESLPEPTTEKWLEIAYNFNTYANFPNCIGAVDGKHIRVIKPINNTSNFINYKKYFSVVLLAICDANYCFTYIDIGAYGKFADSNIFVNSTFWKRVEQLPLPGNNKPLPFVLVGDDAFPLSPHLMRAYARKNLNNKKKIFNYRLTRARRFIECAFGSLTNKWRIFHRPLNVSQRLCKKIIKSCCVLHNYVCLRDGYKFQHTLSMKGVYNNNQNDAPLINRQGFSIRDEFANYFISPHGKVSWQDSKI